MGRVDSDRLRQSRMQLFSRLKLRNIFPGEWESIYTGEGIEFSAVKPFEPGDDLRDLDLLALAQTGDEEIVQRAAGREMRVYVWADCSGSMIWAEEALFPHKAEIRDIAIALLLYSAQNSYSPVGLYGFAQAEQRFFPARRGESYCDEILAWLVEHEQRGARGPADFDRALTFMMERVAPQSLVFLVSDFHDPALLGDIPALLRPAASRFDLVPIVVRDPIEREATLRRPLRVAVRDSEGGGRAEVFLTPARLREMQTASARHLAYLEHCFHQLGLRPVVLASPLIEDCYQALAEAFRDRRRVPGS